MPDRDHVRRLFHHRASPTPAAPVPTRMSVAGSGVGLISYACPLKRQNFSASLDSRLRNRRAMPLPTSGSLTI